MQGIGELFGSSVDDVLRRPTPALVPALADAALLLAGALVYATAVAGLVLFGHAPHGLPRMPFAVPDALPSVTQLLDPTLFALAEGARGALAVVAITAIAVPVLAYVEGGFVGLLLETYLHKRDDPLRERPVGLRELRDVFERHARDHFGPFLVLHLLHAGVAAAAIVLPRHLPFFKNSLLGLVVFDFLFLYAPFIVVVERRGAFAALRESVRTVADFLATSLVALLFGLLTLGGLAALLGPIERAAAPVGPLVGVAIVAPVGTMLTLFYLKVYLSLRPREWAPSAADPVTQKAVAPAEA